MPFAGYYIYRLLAGDDPSSGAPDRLRRRRRLRRHRRRGGRRRRALRHPAVPRPHGERAGALRAVPPRRRRAGHGARAPALLRPDRGAGHHGRPRRAGAHPAGAAGGAAGGAAAALALGGPRPAPAPHAARRARPRHGLGRVERRAAEDGPRLRPRRTSSSFSGTWDAAMAGYATPGVGNTFIGYLLAGIVGAVLVVGVSWGAAAFLARRRGAGRGRRGARLRTAAPTADARWRARPPTPSPAPSPTSWRTRSSPPGPACCSASTPASSWRRSCSSPSPSASCTRSGRWSAFVVRDRAARGGVPRARALVRPQGLALGRAAGPPHRPAVRARLVHSRPGRRLGRPLHVHRAGSPRRRHAGHPRRRRRGLRPPHHLDDALVRPAARPERPPHARRRGRHPGHDAEADPDPAAHGRADPPRPREPHADARARRGRTGTGSRSAWRSSCASR